MVRQDEKLFVWLLVFSEKTKSKSKVMKSTLLNNMWPGGETGRHKGLKIPGRLSHEGSTPSSATKQKERKLNV